MAMDMDVNRMTPHRTRALILLVDDSATQARASMHALEGAGFRVRLARDGHEALEQAREWRPDVIVSDILMPVMDGFALCREVRRDPLLAHVPVLLQTVTFTDRKDEEFALAIGATRWLLKPANPLDLVREVQAVLAEELGTLSVEIAGVDDPFIKGYRERLSAKLEEKVAELNQANRKLEESVAAYVAELAERRRAEEQLRTRERQQASVTELSNRALQGVDLPDLMDEVVLLVARTLDVEYAKVLELLPDGQELRLRAGVGWQEGIVGQATVSTGADSQAGYTLRSQEPVIVEDLRAETRFNGPPLLHDRGVVSGMSVIIKGHDGPFGVFGVHTTRERKFTSDDLNFLQAVANVLALAIERSHAEEERARLRAEHAARAESEAAAARLQAVFSNLAEGVCILDGDGRLVDANPSFLRLFEISRDELGNHLSQYLDRRAFRYPDGRPLRFEEMAVAAALRGEVFPDGEAHLQTASGDELIVRRSAVPIRDEQGRVVMVVGVVRDTTEERHLQLGREALGRVAFSLVQEQTLARVAEVIVEQARVVLGARGVALWLVDLPHEELRLVAHRGLSEEVVAEAGLLSLHAPLSAALAARTGEPVEVEDILAAGPDLALSAHFAQRGGMRSLFAQPLYARGNLVGILKVLTATPRRFTPWEREMVQEFGALAAVIVENAETFQQVVERADLSEEARTELQRFLGMVAHDLAQPLTTVLGYTHVLSRRLAAQGEARDQRMMQSIERAVRQIQRLVGDLADASRVGVGQFEVSPARMDLVQVARQVVEQVRTTADKHQIMLDAPDRLEGVWDPQRINQLLVNLVSNAVKYSPNGGEVCVTIRGEADHVLVSVSDQGDGMTAEQIERLFRPFSRLERERARGIKGMGLGLYLCKAIVDAHGGRIGVESKVGKGSVFHFALPAKRP